MSRMISEARALNNGKQVRQIYRVSLMAFLSIGIIGSALMLIIPKQLANMMENPNAMWSIFALGPAVLFVCYISACRGFFQGQGNMAPTAVSQIIEALCKLFLGLGLAWLVMNRLGDGPLAAAGSIAGVTIGTVLSASTSSARRAAARASSPARRGRQDPQARRSSACWPLPCPSRSAQPVCRSSTCSMRRRS